MQLDLVAQLLARGLITGSVYAMLGVSWGIIYNTTRTFHFAHGLVYGMAAYLAVSMAALGAGLFLSLLAALAGSVLMGVLMEQWAYRPMRRKNASQLSIFLTAMGIMVAGQSLIHLFYGPDSRPLKLMHEKVLTLGSMTFTSIDLVAVFTSWAAMILLALFLTRSKAGTMIRAVASNPEKATFIGINTHRIFLLAFALGSFLMGLAAFVSTLEMPATPYVGIQALLMSFITVFLGGVGSLVGAVLGGLALGLLESMVLLVLPAQFKLVVTFAVLFLVIIVRPQGFLGEKAS